MFEMTGFKTRDYRAMVYHTTILAQMLQSVSKLEFQSIVFRPKGDCRARKLHCRDHCVGQHGNRDLLGETISACHSLLANFYHFGTVKLRRSTLSDVNKKRFIRDLSRLLAGYYKLLITRKAQFKLLSGLYKVAYRPEKRSRI